MAQLSSFQLFLLYLVCCFFTVSKSVEVDFVYHRFPALSSTLRQFSEEYPQLTKLYSIGKSVKGRDLLVLHLTSHPNEDPLLKPNVKYVANMHGNEPVGRELMLHLIKYLLEGYGHDEYVTWLLDHTHIHIMPTMNPDGFEAAAEGACSGVNGRGNANNVDLNRNFPDYFAGLPSAQLQPETLAIMNWLDRTQFVLSANFHGGALVASYPFDNVPQTTPKNLRGMTSSLTPDDDVFEHLAETYSFNHKTMHLAPSCRDGSPPFDNGTTNGAAWYALQGGMQDYNYVRGGCMEITMEISCCKYPKYHTLPQFWSENRISLLRYLGEAHQGVWGQVMDHKRNPISNATVFIKGRDIGGHTTRRGEYWRILRPGTYTIQVQARGYESAEVDVIVAKGVTVQNVTLYPGSNYDHDIEVTDYRSPLTVRNHNSGNTLRAVWPTFTNFLKPKEAVIFPHTTSYAFHSSPSFPFDYFPTTSRMNYNILG